MDVAVGGRVFSWVGLGLALAPVEDLVRRLRHGRHLERMKGWERMRYLDAHNHLQDDRFGGRQEVLIEECRAVGVVRMMVNGSCAEDWPAVLNLARKHPGLIRPSLGWHPWYLHEREEGWERELEAALDHEPDAGVGEIGMDRWILEQPPAIRARYAPGLAGVEPAGLEEQERVFRHQLRLAARRDRPVTVHGLRVWGRMVEVLGSEPLPRCGFLLHSYGGPVELVPVLARLGAYFGFPGYFLHERKQRQREVFRAVPVDRLLVETDAPDQVPPADCITHPLMGTDGERPLNHPANLATIQTGLARWLGVDEGELAERLEENFERWAGRG